MGTSGTQLQSNNTGFTQRALGVNVVATTPQFMLVGYNDMRAEGLSANNLMTFKETLYGDVAWLAIPSASKLRSSSGSITYVGSWTSATTMYGVSNPYKGSTTAGDTATATLSGTAIYVCFETETGFTQKFTVLVDGVDQGPFAPNYMASSVNGVANGGLPATTGSLFFVRVTGLTNTTHTVQVQVQSGSTDPVNIMYMAGNGTVNSAKLYVGNCLKMNATGYSLGGPNYNSGSDTVVANYNAAISQVVADLQSDGLNVVYVDASAVYNPNTQANADNVHPNDAGHAAIAAAFTPAN